MAGLRGNVAWWMFSKQSAKGTAATPSSTNAFKVPFAGGTIGPNRNVETLQETDSSRDRGVAYVSSSGVEGSPECYVRDASIGALLTYALGTDAPTGTTNYTHVITPGSTIPYVTFWRGISDTLWERFLDCKIGGLTIQAEAGNPLQATANVMGRSSTRLTSDPTPSSPALALESSAAYNFNNAAITLSGGATALVRSFELGIENNLTVQQTDDVVPYDVVEGTREINLGFELIFETLDEYNAFHYGSTGGTTQASTIYETDANFTFTLGANNEVSFDLPSIAYEEFPVEPSPGGDPITVQVRAVGQRGGSPIVTATVKNQVASY